MEGTVKWFNKMKNYGFVEDDQGQQYFLHGSALEQGTFVREGDRVSFEPADGDKGKQAKDVKLLQKASEMDSDGGNESEEESQEEETEEEDSKEEEKKEE
ncbi:cold shock domain-containing protein [archaeon]|nr:cold shock domain-containing protein [archaeon]